MMAICQRKQTIQGKAGHVFTANSVLIALRVPWLLWVQYLHEPLHTSEKTANVFKAGISFGAGWGISP